jgi:hypothetical protein
MVSFWHVSLIILIALMLICELTQVMVLAQLAAADGGLRIHWVTLLIGYNAILAWSHALGDRHIRKNFLLDPGWPWTNGSQLGAFAWLLTALLFTHLCIVWLPAPCSETPSPRGVLRQRKTLSLVFWAGFFLSLAMLFASDIPGFGPPVGPNAEQSVPRLQAETPT